MARTIGAFAPGNVATPNYDDVLAAESLVKANMTWYPGTGGTTKSSSEQRSGEVKSFDMRTGLRSVVASLQGTSAMQ